LALVAVCFLVAAAALAAAAHRGVGRSGSIRMNKIDEAARSNIRIKIAEAEKHCDSEIVCLISQRSARYVLFPLLIAALIALVMPVAEVFAGMAGYLDVTITFQHQTILFILLAALFVFTPLRLKLTPKWQRQQNCDRFSTEQFFKRKLHETTLRNAVMIFVSWDEKYVTVIADKGINEKVQQADWDRLVSDFVTHVKAGDVEVGFLKIIGGAADLLITHFPATTTKTDELSNHLVELNGPEYLS
jgi:putative membrane protein